MQIVYLMIKILWFNFELKWTSQLLRVFETIILQRKKLRFFAKNLILTIDGLVPTYWHFRPSIELTDLLLIVEMAAGGVRKVEGGDPAGGRVVVL